MKITSPARLASVLDRNLSWRKKELTQLKLTADGSPPVIAGVLRRSALALLYAHWEGFVKDASTYYLTYLSGNALEVGKLKSCFVAIALASDIRASGQSKKASLHAQLVEAIRSLDKPPQLRKRLPKRAISTKSNLKSAVLREITASLGIDYSPFELKEKAVIDRLVASRNLIAHGDGLPVSKSDYELLHAEIIALMDAYKDLIQDAAATDSHLR